MPILKGVPASLPSSIQTVEFSLCRILSFRIKSNQEYYVSRKNAFKNQERKNYHQQYQQLPVHSRTDMDFFKPQQQYEPEPRQMEYDRFGRTTSSQNIVGRPFVDPELQELLNQQYQNNIRMQREQQGGYTGR